MSTPSREPRRNKAGTQAPAGLPLRHLLGATALLVGPTVLTLNIFVLLGDLSPLLAFWAVVIGTLAAAAAVYYFYRDIDRVVRYSARLMGERRATPPRPGSGMLRDLVAAMARLDRRWRGRVALLEQRRQSDEQVIAALNDPIIVLDGQGQALRFNPAAKQALPALRDGASLFRLIDDAAVAKTAGEVLARDEAAQIEIELTGSKRRTYELRIAPFSAEPLDPDALDIVLEEQIEQPALLLTFHDITELRRTERMREDFVANISHELQTPLATFIGFIETIRGPAKGDEAAQERFLGIMHEQASHMSRLVRELLSLSKLENSEQGPPTDHVNLGGVLDQVKERLALKAASRAIRIRTDLPADLPPLLAERDQMIQLFQNLIDNAIKYGRTGSAVQVTAERQDGTVRIAVADQGRGIPAEHIPMITERFYRVPEQDPKHAKAVGKVGGMGLGLAIVSHIVRRHGGTLEIDSEEGTGSTFTVTLPLASGVAGPRETAA